MVISILDSIYKSSSDSNIATTFFVSSVELSVTSCQIMAINGSSVPVIKFTYAS